ncbi:MAG: DUF2961 domain-containing protein [bacterium]
MHYNKIMPSIHNHELHGLHLGLLYKPIQTVGVLSGAEIAPAEEKVLCDLTGAGVIKNIWLSFVEEHVARAARFKVYIDGEITPSIDIDMGTLGVAFYYTQGFRGGWCKHMWVGQSSATSPTGMVFRYPIPYSTGVKITVYNPVAYTSAMSSQIYNVPNLELPLRLKSSCVPWITPLSLGTPYQHINLTNTEGWLLYNTLTVDSTMNPVLESNMQIYIDGAQTPTLETTGTEDWFDDAWYFGGRAPSIPWRMISVSDNSGCRYMLALDLMEMFGGLYFSHNVRTVWEANTIGIFTYIWLWYEMLR